MRHVMYISITLFVLCVFFGPENVGSFFGRIMHLFCLGVLRFLNAIWVAGSGA